MNESEYNTNDIYLSSFLMTQERFKLKEVRDNGSGRKLFVFEPKPDDATILSFYSGEARVSALKLLESFQSLKSATYVLCRREGDRNEVKG